MFTTTVLRWHSAGYFHVTLDCGNFPDSGDRLRTYCVTAQHVLLFGNNVGEHWARHGGEAALHAGQGGSGDRLHFRHWQDLRAGQRDHAFVQSLPPRATQPNRFFHLFCALQRRLLYVFLEVYISSSVFRS